MTIRRKLLTIFSAVALLSVMVAGTTLWSAMTLQELHHELEAQYQRSLLLQRIRSAVVTSFHEHVPDAVAEGEESRQRFLALHRQVQSDLEKWATLIDEAHEEHSLQQIRIVYTSLSAEALDAFDEMDAGRPEKALAWLYRFRSRGNIEDFEKLAERMETQDRQRIRHIRTKVEGTRSTINVVAVLAVIGTLSLVLLMAAYLASDLFAPLRELERALLLLARGDHGTRLNDSRNDELGQINAAFNRVVASHSSNGTHVQTATTQAATLNAMSEVAACAKQLQETIQGASNTSNDDVNVQVEFIAEALERMAAVSLPLRLTPVSTDVRRLLYDVVADFREEMARRGVSVDLQLASDANRATVDRLRLREALRELISNALAALPESGGRLALRAKVDGEELVLDVADNGQGTDVDRLRDAAGGTSGRRLGLWLVHEIVERHGGHLELDSALGEGTHVQLRLPLHPVRDV